MLLHFVLALGLKYSRLGATTAVPILPSQPLNLRFVQVPSKDLSVVGPVTPSPAGQNAPARSPALPSVSKPQPRASAPTQPQGNAVSPSAASPSPAPATSDDAKFKEQLRKDIPSLAKALTNLDQYISHDPGPAPDGGGAGKGLGKLPGGNGGAGGPGGTGGNGFAGTGAGAYFDTQGYDLGPWGNRVVAIVRSNWSVPPAASLGLKGIVTISFSVDKISGKLQNLQIVSSSGIPAFDQAALNSLKISNPFPPLPSDFPRSNLGAVFRFFYNTPIPK